MIRGNAHATVHLRTINQFLKLVHVHANNSQYTIYINCVCVLIIITTDLFTSNYLVLRTRVSI